jgi:hypothetical protein
VPLFCCGPERDAATTASTPTRNISTHVSNTSKQLQRGKRNAIDAQYATSYVHAFFTYLIVVACLSYGYWYSNVQ